MIKPCAAIWSKSNVLKPEVGIELQNEMGYGSKGSIGVEPISDRNKK